MDLASTGSTISKIQVEDAFIVTSLMEKKLSESDNKKQENIKEEIDVIMNEQELNIDDFIDDFKL